MSSKRVGGVIGAIVAILVLGVAIMSGPMDQHQAPAHVEHSVATAPAVVSTVVAAPATPAAAESGAKRNVIREVPN